MFLQPPADFTAQVRDESWGYRADKAGWGVFHYWRGRMNKQGLY